MNMISEPVRHHESALNRRLQISFLLPSIPTGPGGGTRVIYEYANHLVAQGHRVSLVMPRQPAGTSRRGSWTRRLGAAALRPILGASGRWQWLDPQVKLHRVPSLQSKFIPASDAIVATAWPTAEALHAAPAEVGQKFYLIQDYETWSGPAGRVDATWRFPMTKIVVAHWLEELGNKLGAQDVHCIPDAINDKIFRVTRPFAARPKRVAMMVSHLARKGSADGIAALQLVRQQHPDLGAVLFGKLPYFSRPRWIQYCWNPQIAILVNEIYNQSRIFVCPSWWEGFGLPGLESMACGCALVSTDCLGVREYATHGVNALFSPPKDPEALARNINTLLTDDALRQRLAAAGTAAVAGFAWDDRVQRLERLLLSKCRPDLPLAPLLPGGAAGPA